MPLVTVIKNPDAPVILIHGGNPSKALIKQLSDKGARVMGVEESDLPVDARFIDAWTIQDGAVCVDICAAREVAHARRRATRDAQMRPLDALIGARIPGRSFEDVDAERQAIRDADSSLQIEIDRANTIDVLSRVTP